MKSPRTPRSQIKHVIQLLYLRSRERHAAIKRDNYSCVICGVKQSKAKGHEQRVEVDHIDGIDWEFVIDLIYERVLVHPDKLQTLCFSDHQEKTLRERLKRESSKIPSTLGTVGPGS